LGRLPLRVQLVAVMVVLLAAALLGTWWAASAEMRQYLLRQLDSRLEHTTSQIARFASNPLALKPTKGPGFPAAAYVVETRDKNHLTVVQSGPVAAGDLPDIPDNPVLDQPFTVSAKDGARQWRVLAVQVVGADGGPPVVVQVAADQSDVDTANGDLTRRFLLIALGGLVLMGIAALALVRGSLAPLEEVEQTAEAIAGGEMSRRVPVRRPGTEVGRLASAFNAMVDRIGSLLRARELSETSARRSEERMRRFVADASHELRTPLTSIRGYAELYRQGAVTDPEDVASVVRRIEDAAARMGLLVDDLLLLARLDQQRPLERTPVDLGVLVVDAVHDAHATDPGRPIGLRLPPADPTTEASQATQATQDTADSFAENAGSFAGNGDDADDADDADDFDDADEPVAVPVLGDEARLRQVIGNLVSNAINHTPPDTPVEVRLRTEDGSAVLEVADSGPGLSAEQAERVFERFYRADPARGRVSGGTGLGLAIVAALVAAHGGRVEVDTTVGAGTTFRVYLPLSSS
jgi:two-component system OmpR family sensor kinase